MPPCYAITSSHLGFLQQRKTLWVCSHARMMCLQQLVPDSIVRILLQLRFVREEVASFLKHIQTERKWAVCSSLVIVASAFVSPAERQLRLTSYPARSPGPLRAPWPRNIQRGATGAVKTHTSACSHGECSSSCCPTGPSLHTPANQLHLCEQLAPSGWRPLFSPLLSGAPLKSCVSVSLWLERVR